MSDLLKIKQDRPRQLRDTMTQAEVASLLHVSRASVTRWCKGGTVTPLAKIVLSALRSGKISPSDIRGWLDGQIVTLVAASPAAAFERWLAEKPAVPAGGPTEESSEIHVLWTHRKPEGVTWNRKLRRYEYDEK